MRSTVLISCIAFCLLMVSASVRAEAGEGFLTISASKDGIQVTLDGKPAGKTPVVTRVAPGEHTIAFPGNDGKPVSAQFTIAAKDSVMIWFDRAQELIRVFHGVEEIRGFLQELSDRVRFDEFVAKAKALYAEKKPLEAIRMMKKALAITNSAEAVTLLKDWRKEQMPKDFAYVTGGLFLMGSPKTELVTDLPDHPQHKVRLSDYGLCMTEVTVKQFERFMADTGYRTTAELYGGAPVWDAKASQWKTVTGAFWKHPQGNVKGTPKARDDEPVVQVSWFDATAYANWLTNSLQLPSGTITLPAEAQWEFACRGSRKRAWPWGTDDPFVKTELAVLATNWLQPVGSKKAGVSPDGLLDLVGNAWEWCSDVASAEYYEVCEKLDTVTDPRGPEKGSRRVLRGGGYETGAGALSTTFRLGGFPDTMSSSIGFRLAWNFEPLEAEQQ